MDNATARAAIGILASMAGFVGMALFRVARTSDYPLIGGVLGLASLSMGIMGLVIAFFGKW